MRNNQVSSCFHFLCFWEGWLWQEGWPWEGWFALLLLQLGGFRFNHRPAALCRQAGGQARPGCPRHCPASQLRCPEWIDSGDDKQALGFAVV